MRNPFCPCSGRRGTISRRSALAALGVAPWLDRVRAAVAAPPTSPVSIGRCAGYGPELSATLARMFDQLGGLGRLVAGKTVAIKVNMTGSPDMRLGTTPCELTHFTHPAVVGATIRLLGAAGARRIRVLEGCFVCNDPLEEFMYAAGWEPRDLLNAASLVEMENTNVLGRGKQYLRRMAATPGYIFSGFDVNHAYIESDVIVSIAKLKEHATVGVTLGMKNMFGATPITIYGDGAGKDEPSADARGGRGLVMHDGSRPPSKSAPQEVDPKSPRDSSYRMPRIVVDVAAAMPIHLTILDGISTMAGGEGPWLDQGRVVTPGVLIAGLNAVCTDTVGTAVMGYDPMAKRGQPPFDTCDNFLALAAARGLGTNDLSQIEIAGTPIRDVAFSFRTHRPGGFPGSLNAPPPGGPAGPPAGAPDGQPSGPPKS
jgi:uncharacterized protein (DUF362 family)